MKYSARCAEILIALHYYTGFAMGLPFETIVARAYLVCDNAVRIGFLRACYDGDGASIDGDGFPATIIIDLVRSLYSHFA